MSSVVTFSFSFSPFTMVTARWRKKKTKSRGVYCVIFSGKKVVMEGFRGAVLYDFPSCSDPVSSPGFLLIVSGSVVGIARYL
jgi:hypothetical protein